jgi:hypothetical protein
MLPRASFAERLQQSADILRHSRPKRNPRARPGMIDHQTFSVQHLTGERIQQNRPTPHRSGLAPVYLIADDGMTKVRQMNADLMSAAGPGFETEPAHGAGMHIVIEKKTPLDPPFRHRIARST